MIYIDHINSFVVMIADKNGGQDVNMKIIPHTECLMNQKYNYTTNYQK